MSARSGPSGRPRRRHALDHRLEQVADPDAGLGRDAQDAVRVHAQQVGHLLRALVGLGARAGRSC
jgi:hypothetical protein